jgi:curved DNA-binding protein CbpA
MKTDAFALLGLPRRASLTAEEVRAAFQRAAAKTHPDGANDTADRDRRTGEFAALNEACAVVSSVPRRLRHLLELEHPDTAALKTGVVMDGATMELFASTGAAVQAAASVLARKKTAATALARAMMAGEEMQAQETLEAASRRLESACAVLDTELSELDEARSAGAEVEQKLRSYAARAGFLEKWQAQLRAAFAGFFGT